MRFGIACFGSTIDFIYTSFHRYHQDKAAGGSFYDMAAAKIDPSRLQNKYNYCTVLIKIFVYPYTFG